VRSRQVGGAAHVGVTWSGPLLPRQAIPTRQLYANLAATYAWRQSTRTTISPVWSEVVTEGRDMPVTATVGDQPLMAVALDAHHVAVSAVAAPSPGSQAPLGIPLSPGANSITMTVGGGTATATRSVVWEALDLTQVTSDTPPVALRVGDTLLATATGNGAVLQMEMVLEGDTPVCTVTAPTPASPGTGIRVQALRPGTAYLRGLIDGQEVGRVAIAVVGCAWNGSQPLACQIGFRRTATVQMMDATAAQWARVWLGAADSRHLEVSELLGSPDLPADWRQVQVRALGPAPSAVQVRLGGQGGPLVAQAVVTPFDMILATETHIPVREQMADNSRIVEGHLRLVPPLPGLDIRLGIFTSGAQFPDGAFDRHVDSTQLPDGELRYPILVAAGAGSFVCHVINVHQDGIFVGGR
jgi:hypothetical protein